jgi:uncharacterized protein (DUF1697 family)
MAGFLTQGTKDNIKAVIDRIHDTFSRPIVAYKAGQKITIYTSDGYNALYKNNPTVPKQELQQNSKTIYARIKYESFDQDNFYQGSSQEKIIIPEGAIYIKVNKEGYDWIKLSRTIELDGKTFAVKSPGKPEGMFGPQYYKFLLIPLES